MIHSINVLIFMDNNLVRVSDSDSDSVGVNFLSICHNYSDFNISLFTAITEMSN